MGKHVPDSKIHGKGNCEFDIINFEDLSHIQVNTNLEKDILTNFDTIQKNISKMFIV